jgi:RNA-dependent RNA polymerase
MKNDYLGIVANIHSKVADSHREAIHQEDCLKLAEMHSKAVNYTKHGELLDVDALLVLKSKYKYHVDYMSISGKNRKNTIESPGVLGEMYRHLNTTLNRENLLELEYKFHILRNYDLPKYFFEDKEF